MSGDTYATLYARRKRRERWMQAAARATRCPARLARGVVCRMPLQSRFVGGVTVPFCPTCEKKDRGVCIEAGCDAPVYGQPRKALRCALHRKLAHAAQLAQYRQTNRGKRAAREKERARANREDRREYKRLYRQACPQKAARAKQAAYQRNREKALAYHAAYRAARRAEIAERERLRHHGQLPPRTCLTCDTVLTGRAKKCDPCKARARAEARAAIAARLEVAA